MRIPATHLRVGMLVKRDEELYRIMTLVHITPGNKRGLVQTKLRHLRLGTQTEVRFRSDENVERVSLEQQEMEYLYEADGLFHFMNTGTYEQITLSRDDLGTAVDYLIPNLRIQVEFYEGNPIGVSLAKTIDLTVSETQPGLKGATATNQLKPATLETGLVVQVPPFIDPGDVIRVDTESGAYVSRAK
jgi:elongation factor P